MRCAARVATERGDSNYVIDKHGRVYQMVTRMSRGRTGLAWLSRGLLGSIGQIEVKCLVARVCQGIQLHAESLGEGRHLVEFGIQGSEPLH